MVHNITSLIIQIYVLYQTSIETKKAAQTGGYIPIN
nr:MAG TPA: hypothetical protein [Caudoviricetes sp.]